MKFEAREIDIDLELVAKKGSDGKKEKKTFKPFKEVTAEWAGSIIKETDEYVKNQQLLPVSEQDRMYVGNLKFLGWIYKDFDIDWMLKNFTPVEISEIRDSVFQGLLGVKKEDGN